MHEKTDEFDMVDTEIEVEVNDSSTKCKTRLHKPICINLSQSAYAVMSQGLHNHTISLNQSVKNNS